MSRGTILAMGLDTLDAIRTRRVAAWYADKAVPDELLRVVLEAARWAPTASNRRVHRFVCLTDREHVRRIGMFTPGMVAGLPSALIIICVNWKLAAYETVLGTYHHVYFDTGAALENMLLAAHALGLAAGPMGSFSKEAVRVLLNLPDKLEPQILIGLGYPTELPAHAPRWPKKKLAIEDIVQWGPYPQMQASS